MTRLDGQRRNATSAYHSPEYQRMARAVRRRDVVCQLCGATAQLHVHHVDRGAARRGEHDPARALLLCRMHHDQVEAALKAGRLEAPIVARVAAALAQAIGRTGP